MTDTQSPNQSPQYDWHVETLFRVLSVTDMKSYMSKSFLRQTRKVPFMSYTVPCHTVKLFRSDTQNSRSKSSVWQKHRVPCQSPLLVKHTESHIPVLCMTETQSPMSESSIGKTHRIPCQSPTVWSLTESSLRQTLRIPCQSPMNDRHAGWQSFNNDILT